ncbi:MAG: hypothetical protein A2580_15305 [Hydrogenophilales bacterium RIFOXYD1_FULL_62_11]|nr:MAG: hypothetical protein A2580_15305 [Hydrogenophilales bacterium RIFOXYD1_FULL_62_11]
MNTLRALLTPMLLAVMAGCSTVPVANAPPAELAIEQSWSGDYPVAELKLLPEGQQQFGAGYLGSAAAFAPVWAAFRPGEAIPTVNFSKQMVVFHRNVNFYNRTRIFKVTLKDGVADVLAAETMSAIPVTDKVAMALAVIPRAGVKAIQAGTVRIPVRTE